MTITSQQQKHLDTFSAAKLLNTSTQPESIFTDNEDAIQSEYRYLIKRWHPDAPSGSADVTRQLKVLRDAALGKIAKGIWQVPGELLLHPTSGKAKLIKFRKKVPFELGDMYISQTLVTYVVDPVHKKLFDSAIARMKSFSYPNDKIKDNCERYLPKIKASFESKEGLVLVLEKASDLIRVADWVAHEGGKVDAKHAAWVLSSLYDLANYFRWANICHNDISPDNYFIAPAEHSGALLGGWWYAAENETTIKALPDRTYDNAPPDVLNSGKADPRVDLSMIRRAGREMLGDPAGLSIHKDKTIPEAISNWLRMPASGDAREEYKIWMDQVLTSGFGARRFVELKVKFSDVYPR
jgi:hypothetical protein